MQDSRLSYIPISFGITAIFSINTIPMSYRERLINALKPASLMK